MQRLKASVNLCMAAIGLITFWIASSASAREMTFDIIYNNHTNIIVGNGDITAETPMRFQEFLDSDKLDGFRFIVHLNSNGGSLYGGIELGKLIRENGFATGVQAYDAREPGESSWWPSERPGHCMSACALAFLGGKVRAIGSGSSIGFHQFSSHRASTDEQPEASATEAMTQIISSDVLDYIVRMGASLELFLHMSNALPDQMYIPRGDELRSLKVISQTAFRDFGFEPYKVGVIAYATFPENVEGRSVVYQITTFCKGGIPYVLLSGVPGSQGLTPEWISGSQEYLSGFSISSNKTGRSTSYPASNVRFRSGSTALAEIKLDPVGAATLMEDGHGSISIPGASGFLFEFKLEASESDVDKIRSSFTHCIS